MTASTAPLPPGRQAQRTPMRPPYILRGLRRAAAVAWAVLVFSAAAMDRAAAQGVRPETLASGLENPWALAFLPEGRFLVTERPGRMRVIEVDGRLGAPLAGLPPIVAGGQGGLLDVVTDSDFARNRQLYFCYAEPGAGGNSTALARARLAADRRVAALDRHIVSLVGSGSP